MQVLAILKYILKLAGEIMIKGKEVNAARRNRDPMAKKIDIHT